MNDTAGPKQQIVEQIKNSSNILVTLSKDPDVDALTSALGLTIMLNNLNKHATAVVSGKLPLAIEFLDPGKTFEGTVDSLRDFIIALDKEKADHLRYKVDGDVVKIFITPYRTTITESDLDFSQGDYNVELVLALGVENQDHLDAALEAHGRILHDATVAILTCGDQKTSLGGINWSEPGASSLSEMLVSLSEALKSDKPVIDEQIATAFLTGIVAATDRFSNNKTSSKVMTMAAQLMAAGANQQLIAAKLEEAHEIGNTDAGDDQNADGSTDLSEGEASKVNKKASGAKKSEKSAEEPESKSEKPADDGSLAISHEKEGSLDDVTKQTVQENEADAAKAAEQKLAEQLQTVAPATATPSVADLQKDLAAASAEVEKAAAEPKEPTETTSEAPEHEPALGGTLNATTEQAAEDRRKEESSDQNKTILTHNTGDYIGDQKPTYEAPINALNKPSDEPTVQNPFDQAVDSLPAHDTSGTLEDIDKRNRNAEHESAQADVAAALASAESTPTSTPTPTPTTPDLTMPTALPPLPDFSIAPPLPPPLPDLGQVTATPQNPQTPAPAPSAPEPTTPTPPAEPVNDPNQFQIPGSDQK